MARRPPREHRRGRIRAGAARPRAPGAGVSGGDAGRTAARGHPHAAAAAGAAARLRPASAGQPGAGFMLLETKSIVQFALLWGSTWSSASLAIASVLAMALASALVVARIEIRRRRVIAAFLFGLLALNYAIPVGRVAFGSRALESVFYALLVFSPVFCAGLLFSASFKQSSSTAADFGANLLGAMVGGVGEYLSLLAGYRSLLFLVAACYGLAIASRRIASRRIADCGLRIAD